MRKLQLCTYTRATYLHRPRPPPRMSQTITTNRIRALHIENELPLKVSRCEIRHTSSSGSKTDEGDRAIDCNTANGDSMQSELILVKPRVWFVDDARDRKRMKSKEKSKPNTIRKSQTRKRTDSEESIRKCLKQIESMSLLERVNILLRKGINPKNCVDQQCMTPLHIACRDDDVAVVKLLAKTPNDVNLALRTSDAVRPIHIAAKNGSTKVLRYLLGRGDCDVNARERHNGNSATALAAAEGKAEALRMLLACDRVQWYAANSCGETPLDQAGYRGKVECVNLIVQTATLGVVPSVPPHLATQEKALNRSSIALVENAVAGNMLGVNDEIDLGADIDGVGECGRLRIHCAAVNGDSEMTLYLIDRRANINAQDLSGLTPLVHAAMRGHANVVAVLLKDASLEVNFRCRHTKETALHVAAELGFAETCQVLLACPRVKVNVREKYKRTPAHLATQSGDLSTLEAFIARAGCESDDVNLSLRCMYGGTITHHAISGYLGPSRLSASAQVSMIDVLLRSGFADLTTRDAENRTPYMWAKEKGRSEVCALLRPADDLACTLATSEGGMRLVERKPSLGLFDYVTESDISAEDRDARSIQVWTLAIRPRLELCILKECAPEDKDVLKILLNRTQGQRRSYRAEFCQVVNDGIAALQKDFEHVQNAVSVDKFGRQLVELTPEYKYYGNYDPYTLHHFNDECLGDKLTKTAGDDVAWIRVATETGCCTNAQDFIKLYRHGDHECLDQPYPELQATGVKKPRGNYVVLLLAYLHYKLNPPFQEAMKKQFEPAFGVVSPQLKKFSRLMESSEKYAKERGVTYGLSCVESKIFTIEMQTQLADIVISRRQ
eukprot:GEMP01015690.1.p1 GENE.GEMP01015690.1~~GEMP01015690.1.p1  ORF type:complete len:841 (+),score=177.35 GEMP01015690.1:170-2692(+)